MELLGEVSIQAPRQAVWAALNDPAVLRACIPGCEEVVDESPLVRRVQLMVRIGPVRARFTGRVTLSEVREPESCVLAFEGSGGAAGMASGQSRVTLVEEADGTTQLSYSVNAAVGGKLGQIGGRLIDASARQLAQQFFSAFRDRILGGPVVQAEDVAAQPAGLAPPAASEPAALGGRAWSGEAGRLLWFGMGVLATAVGVILGALLFGRAG
jgi:carbon monoxide dehydrogenase subunit G